MLDSDCKNIGRESLRVYDHLRSLGFALPFMGISVDEMVAMRWVVLESKNAEK